MTTEHDRRIALCNALAHRAWPDTAAVVSLADDGTWLAHAGGGVMLAHPSFERFATALAVLAGDSSPPMSVALDAVEKMIRERATYGMGCDGIDVVGFREDGVHLWSVEGKIGTGATLRDALENLDRRRQSKGPDHGA